MASLFGKHRLKDLAEKVKTDDIADYIEIVKAWHNDFHNGSLKEDKETSREQSYNQDFFIKILGYREKPANPYSLEPKATTEKGQLPDAVLSHTDTGKDINNISAVVELKGASVDLDRPQRREGNMSPVQQGFKYKTQYRNCPFVVVSNFWEFRLYRDNLLDYEAWTLDDLVNPENDYLLFKTWYVLMLKENFTASSGASKTEDFLSDIRIEQEEIGKKFYKVYREARLDLLRNIYSNNPDVRKNIDFGIEKAQKIIDRVVFSCFAEDKGLLPENTLHRVLKAAEGSAFGGSLWNTLKGFFEAIDTGSDKLDIPEGYNGGLFKHDQELNNLKIDDAPLEVVLSLGSYNFEEDLSVTILGHIFEQSISDLEEIKNKVNESQDLETISHSRRKKDGIYYTPDYIVRYIVDNSLGTYLREHEEKFKDEFKLKGDINDKNYEKREQQAYEKYQVFLQNVKVLDPACGSGAFLVYVFDYLMEENKRVASILGGGLFSNDQYIRSILKNNIFGVDLNEESVEITKLSLWLKSAERGKKLTTLDKNIKCGNSLISNPSIAGKKAFNWTEEFKEVMASGGFDVVVGNPPYVFTRENMASEEKQFFLEHYKNTQFKLNTYILFTEKSFNILRPNGLLGFIVPNNWMTLEFNSDFRKFILTECSDILIVTTHDKVFKDASVDTSILIFKKGGENKEISAIELKNEIFELSSVKDSSDFINATDFILHFSSDEFEEISNKIEKNSILLSDIAEVKNGVQCYTVGEGDPVQTKEMKDSRVYHSDHKVDETWFPYLEGSDMQRYYLDWSGVWVKYGSNLSRKRKWELFNGERIVVRQIPAKPPYSIIASYTSETIVNDNNGMIVRVINGDYDINFILAVLNSKLISYWFIHSFGKLQRKTFPQFKVKELSRFLIPKAEKKAQMELSEIASRNTKLHSDLNNLTKRFQKLLQSEFEVSKFSQKLKRWWDLDFEEFVNSLSVKIALKDKSELIEIFEKYCSDGSKISNEIDETNRKIDQFMYKIYDLTDDEVTAIESPTAT